MINHARSSKFGISSVVIRPFVEFLLASRYFRISRIGDSSWTYSLSSMFCLEAVNWLEFDLVGVESPVVDCSRVVITQVHAHEASFILCNQTIGKRVSWSLSMFLQCFQCRSAQSCCISALMVESISAASHFTRNYYSYQITINCHRASVEFVDIETVLISLYFLPFLLAAFIVTFHNVHSYCPIFWSSLPTLNLNIVNELIVSTRRCEYKVTHITFECYCVNLHALSAYFSQINVFLLTIIPNYILLAFSWNTKQISIWVVAVVVSCWSMWKVLRHWHFGWNFELYLFDSQTATSINSSTLHSVSKITERSQLLVRSSY